MPEDKVDDPQQAAGPMVSYDYATQKAKNIEQNKVLLEQLGLLNVSASLVEGKGKGRASKKRREKNPRKVSTA